MELKNFCEYISVLKSYKQIQERLLSYPKIIDAKYDELLEYGKKIFADHDDNIQRWLDGRTCICVNPNTHRIIEYKIGNDCEALYYFLMLCKRINHRKSVSDEYREYLAFLITRSNCPNWEEC